MKFCLQERGIEMGSKEVKLKKNSNFMCKWILSVQIIFPLWILFYFDYCYTLFINH